MDERELDYLEKLEDRRQEIIQEIEDDHIAYHNRHDPAEDIVFNESPADDYFPDNDYCEDPWGNFKWWMYTQKIRQLLLDYFYVMEHTYNINETVWFRLIGISAVDFGVAHDLLPEVLDELNESRADDAAELDESEWNY